LRDTRRWDDERATPEDAVTVNFHRSLLRSKASLGASCRLMRSCIVFGCRRRPCPGQARPPTTCHARGVRSARGTWSIDCPGQTRIHATRCPARPRPCDGFVRQRPGAIARLTAASSAGQPVASTYTYSSRGSTPGQISVRHPVRRRPCEGVSGGAPRSPGPDACAYRAHSQRACARSDDRIADPSSGQRATRRAELASARCRSSTSRPHALRLQSCSSTSTKSSRKRGYQGTVVVCAVYFFPVAGHVPERSTIKYWSSSDRH